MANFFLTSQKGTDIVSAATITLPTDGNDFDVTGSTGPITTINTNGRAVGTPFRLRFASTPTINHDGTALIIPGGSNHTAVAGDSFVGRVVGTNQVRILQINHASGAAKASHTHAAADVTSGEFAAARLPAMVGDSGSGGTKGAVPAPAAGDAAASKFLKADGTWAAPGGGGGAWTQIAESIVTGSDAAMVTFSSIPADYRHLVLTIAGRSSQAAATTTVRCEINDVSSGSYYWSYNHIGSATSYTGGEADTAATVALIAGASAPASAVAGVHIIFYDYARTAWHKAWRGDSVLPYSTSAEGHLAGILAGRIADTAAIAKLDLSCGTGDFKVDSVFTLWGIE